MPSSRRPARFVGKVLWPGPDVSGPPRSPGERGGPRKRLLFALRREPADGAYGRIVTVWVSAPPALEVTVIDGVKVGGEVIAADVSV